MADRAVWWTLRVAAAGCFVGHGAFGVIGKSEWLPFFQVAGIGESTAWWLMLVVGASDIAIGLSLLVWPTRATLAYMAVWTVWTAALRPLSGLSIWEMVERAGNYGVPIALLVWTWPGVRNATGSWLRRIEPQGLGARASTVATVLALSTALLLVGHGALAFEGKPLLDRHLMLLGLPPVALAAQGWIEVTLGLACALTREPMLLLAACLWKVASESLFLLTGAWRWELVERAGSYGAPLAAALLFAALLRSRRSRSSATTAAATSPA